MKYLKSIFENTEYEDWGITPEEVNHIFADLQDIHCLYRVNFRKKLFNPSSQEINRILGDSLSGRKMNLALKPIIEVIVRTEKPSSSASIQKQILEDIYNSEEFKEILDVANDRLKIYGWQLSTDSRYGVPEIKVGPDYLKILIIKTNI